VKLKVRPGSLPRYWTGIKGVGVRGAVVLRIQHPRRTAQAVGRTIPTRVGSRIRGWRGRPLSKPGVIIVGLRETMISLEGVVRWLVVSSPSGMSMIIGPLDVTWSTLGRAADVSVAASRHPKAILLLDGNSLLTMWRANPMVSMVWRIFLGPAFILKDVVIVLALHLTMVMRGIKVLFPVNGITGQQVTGRLGFSVS